jgi:hypothetical protein
MSKQSDPSIAGGLAVALVIALSPVAADETTAALAETPPQRP